MVPEGGVWNYNFNGQIFSPNMHYTLMLDNPKDFYNESHRAIHFLDFAGRDETKSTTAEVDTGADREDYFAWGNFQTWTHFNEITILKIKELTKKFINIYN